MRNVTFAQALSIWHELWLCHEGKNGFGGDTAEIYAYRLSRANPMAGHTHALAKAQETKVAQEAAENLVELCSMWCEQLGGYARVRITIDGEDSLDWLAGFASNYTHRAHVRVVHDAAPTDPEARHG